MPRYNYVALNARGEESTGLLEAGSTNEIPAELLAFVPGGAGVGEDSELHSCIEIEPFNGNVAALDQIVTVLKSVEPLVLAMPGVDLPAANGIGPADVKVRPGRNVLAQGAGLQG